MEEPFTQREYVEGGLEAVRAWEEFRAGVVRDLENEDLRERWENIPREPWGDDGRR